MVEVELLGGGDQGLAQVRGGGDGLTDEQY
jgi:hypothetical protein